MRFLKRIPAQVLTFLGLGFLALTQLANRRGTLPDPALFLLAALGVALGLWGLIKLIMEIRNGRPQ